MNELKAKYETLGKEGYELSFETEYMVARLKRVSKRAKGGYKQVWAYRFKSEDQMIKYVSNDYETRAKNIQSDLDYKAKRKEEAKQVSESVNVGDIFCYSWGWEQTNVDFYQVVSKPSKATIIVRAIGYESLETTSWASEYVRPVRDSFLKNSPEEKVRLNGRYFKRSCGYATKVENPETSKHYHSWYA